MSTPASRGAPTRDALVERAGDLFREQGFRATSIGDVVERTGVPKGSLYHHFRSKDQLGYAVLDRWRDEFKVRFLDGLTAVEGPAPLERVVRFLEEFVEAQRSGACRGGCPFGTLAAEMADVHEGFRARLAETFQGFADAIAAQLRRAQVAGTLRAEADASALATFLVATLEGGVLLAKVHRSTVALDTAVGAARAHLDRFRAHPPATGARP
ncbi:MAG: TetR family transcriptional regulator C-terminal domain-containing protein [Planctomycetia bacterium]|nr:TetR family transcriptional regulator C-terminal domain-containing protein [Planctomycetia bacterium]